MSNRGKTAKNKKGNTTRKKKNYNTKKVIEQKNILIDKKDKIEIKKKSKENSDLLEVKQHKKTTKTKSELNKEKNKIPSEKKIDKKLEEMIEEKKEETTKESSSKKKIWYIFLILFLLLLIMSGLCVYFFLIDVIKKDVYIELGTNTVTISDFFKRNKIKNSSIVTDIDKLDFSKLGDYDIEIQVGKRKKTIFSTLHIEDTTKPVVEFQDVYGYIDYNFNVEDFIVSKSDLTEMKVTSDTEEVPQEFGDYPVTITVSDTSGNETIGKQILHIGALKKEYFLELGSTLEKTDILYNKNDLDSIPDEIIKKINKSGVGEYIVEATIDGKVFTSNVIVQDTKAPELKLKNVVIYDDTKEVKAEQFISKINEASDYTISILSDIPYGTEGKYEIVIEAIDFYGNKTTDIATLTIQKDKKPPVISGLSNITINKNAAINYLSGVKAVDAKDGIVEVIVNYDSVNRSVAGTYYATYTAVDKSGNKATAKRKITVKHDQSDVNQKINEIKGSIGSSVKDVYNYVKAHVRYSSSWGDNDPLWYALTNWKGNCYVQATILKRLLEEKGYQAQLIWVTNKTHYWVLVNIGNGVWRHVDTVYNMSMANDDQRFADLHGREWDRSAWPAAV